VRLYDGGQAPDSRRVRIFLAEKGVKIPLEPAEPEAVEHNSTGLKPLQRLPALVLDDETVISESIAICRYFEALRPAPPVFGRGAREIALVEMWNRRMELNLFRPVSAVLRHLTAAMNEPDNQRPELRQPDKPQVDEFLAMLDRELTDRLFIAGEHYSVADITGLVAIDLMKPARLAVPAELTNIRRWHAYVSARPSATA
jgi:glutathione S-transferase